MAEKSKRFTRSKHPVHMKPLTSAIAASEKSLLRESLGCNISVMHASIMSFVASWNSLHASDMFFIDEMNIVSLKPLIFGRSVTSFYIIQATTLVEGPFDASIMI